MKRKQIGWVAPAYGGGAMDTDWCVYVLPGDSDVPVVLARFGARRRARQWLRGYRRAWVARGPRLIFTFPPPEMETSHDHQG